MKAIYTLILVLLCTHVSFSNSVLCPDPPINDDPCIESDNPPLDLTEIASHLGNTCCARGPQDENPDGTPADWENVDCSAATQDAAVWYYYTPDPSVDGYTVSYVSEVMEGPASIEIFSGTLDGGCTGALTLIESKCNTNEFEINIGNCYEADEVFFIKVSTDDSEDNCGTFVLSVIATECDNFADECGDLNGALIIQPLTNPNFQIDYGCFTGCLDFACPETDANGGCVEMLQMPTVWFQVQTDEIAAQMFSTVETFGNWTPVWTVYSGPDCDNLSVVNFGGSPPCSNGDNTPDLHQTSVFNEEQNYWIAITVDPGSIPSEGIDNGSFELCVATTVNAIICLGELEGGACDDESLVMEIVERENEGMSLDGPFCPGEEVTVNISFFYDASESGADWFIGFVPTFGEGWDMENFDFDSNAPFGNGQIGIWYEEGHDLAPIIQEPNPILCTYRDENGVLQLCNQLCSPCSDCETQGMEEGDPLPSGYFWVTNGGNAGCDNDGSPGEGWGVGSTTAQIDWTFSLKVAKFSSNDACNDYNDLSISFQTFSDGVAGCWEDPVGECILDRAMFSPAWVVGCNDLPPSVIAGNSTICTKSDAIVEVATEDGSNYTIEIKPIANGFVTGANAYTFENGDGLISDFLVNTSTVDQIQSYEAYAVDSNMVCSGPKTIIEVLVISQYLEDVVTTLCNCSNGCVSIGLETEQDFTYQWSTGEAESIIVVCPVEPTSYFITVTDSQGCEKYESFFVDCEGLSDECIEPIEYKLIYDFFLDTNGDGVKDANENSFAGGSFFLNSFQEIIYNIDLGEGTLYLEEGSYTITYNPDNLEDFDLSTESTFTVDLNELNDCVKIEFGLVSNNENRDLSLYHSLVRQCNSERKFRAFIKNKGSMVENGILWVTLDEIVLPDDFPTQATIDTFIAPNQVGWYFEDLLPEQKLERSVDIYVPGPPDFSPGWVMNFKLNSELENADGSVQFYGEREVALSILCGYDPNDKAVEPAHEEGYTNIDEDKLIYKIRFQNTGNAPTENIEIRDTLSEFLDVNTVRYIAGSHDEFLTLSRVSDRVLSFKFDKIFLPDSTADLEGSQGFLIYEVDILDGVEIGTEIENTAHIYFDRNPAIVTNTTTNILYPDLDMDGFYSIEDCDEENAAINPDAEEIPNNDIDEDCDGVALIIDNDMDGFNSDEDCDDENADINPDAEEIPNNDVDENCDNLIIVIDIDMDGFNSDEDCDDENAEINPDAVEIVNNDVDEDCDGEALVIDNDMDGFNSDEDCDDENADINPDAEEIANNEVDEDCDGEALVIDNDMDGFNSDEDCDDANAEINPDAEEIANNEVDEDCDGEALVIDNDMDGFNSDEDCDDANAEINPDAEEIANNEVDEDCDGEALVIDIDMDGFNSDEDCDDENADINPDAEEIANNEVDENCDGEALVIDNDMDGFNSDEDCDDENADINPDAEEIANNGIDEDCDGMDLVIDNVEEIIEGIVSISPNPSYDAFHITIEKYKNVSYRVINLVGQEVKSGNIGGTNSTIYMGEEASGVYLLMLEFNGTKAYSFHKIIKL